MREERTSHKTVEFHPSQLPGGCSGLVIKYVNMIPAAEMLYIREKLWRFRAALRSSKSIEGIRSEAPVEVRLPNNSLEQINNYNYILQLSDELLLRIFTFLDVKDLIR